MKNVLILPVLSVLLLTGCGADALSDRVYAQAVGLSGGEHLTVSLQGFDEDNCRTVRASGIRDALRLVEAKTGGRVFAGHTELIVLDGTVTREGVQTLFFEEGLSPACKVVFAPQQFLAAHDSTDLVHTIRMAERNALLPETDLSSVLDEWLGTYRTALLPSPGGTVPGMVLLHENGECKRLTDAECRGLFYLRRPPRRMQIEGLGEVQNVSLRKDFSDGTAQLSLTMQAKDADRSRKETIEQTILRDCNAAVLALQREHADVIGVELLLERHGLACPEQLPDITVSVHCR